MPTKIDMFIPVEIDSGQELSRRPMSFSSLLSAPNTRSCFDERASNFGTLRDYVTVFKVSENPFRDGKPAWSGIQLASLRVPPDVLPVPHHQSPFVRLQ